MRLTLCLLEELERGMDAVKKARHDEILTNYFRQPMTGRTLLGTLTPRTVLFINDDTDFFRLFFYSSDTTDLAQVLGESRFPGDVVIDYLSKRPEAGLFEAFCRAGFQSYAVFARLTNGRLRVFEKGKHLQYAEPGDLDEVWAKLMEFDKFADHFPDRNTVLHLIQNQQVIVNRKAGEIDGFILFRVIGSKANFNYLYNHSHDPRDTLTLLHNFYAVLAERGIKTGLAWVNVQNIRVLKLHAQFDWKEDRLRDYIFLRRASSKTLTTQ
jgi:hypothetical protein